MLTWASRYISLVNQYGDRKVCKLGFSWTTLFFLCFTPLYRRDWWSLVVYTILFIITRGVSALIYPFFYNWLYILALLTQGWAPETYSDWQILKANHFSVQEWEGLSTERNSTRDVCGSGQDNTNYPEDKHWSDERDDAIDVEWKE